MVSKSMDMLEGLVREGAFKWLLGNRSSFDDEFEEMSKSPSSRSKLIAELSPIANVVVRRCSRILNTPTDELRANFDSEASESIKHPLKYARNFLEYCCFRALVVSIKVVGHLSDKGFRRLTFDMMLAWEAPASSEEPLLKVDDESTVGREAFARIAPAVPTIADVITCDNLFNILTATTGGRLGFSIYEKYLSGLERSIRKLKTNSESSLLAEIRSQTGEKVLEVDGTVTTQPVLQHIGVSTWPGRLILTDRALYFEDLRVVVSYDKAKMYDLSSDLKQIVKPVLTGPWGTKLFDKAVMYNSNTLSEPVVMEFPELKGHARRDYWLALIREILYAHKFVKKFHIRGIERDDVILKAMLGILRLQAIQEVPLVKPLQCETLLVFNLCDQLPGGDLILETLARMLAARDLEKTKISNTRNSMYSVSALAMMSSLGLSFGKGSTVPREAALFVGDIVVGEMTTLESAIKKSRNNFKKVELAQASLDGVKLEGIDINLAVLEELLLPIVKAGKYLYHLESWDDPVKSLIFCSVSAFIIYREWLGFTFALLLLFLPIFMLLTRWFNRGRSIDELKVKVPPGMNTMEQLLKLQNGLSQLEELVQDGNVVLLKLRALFLSAFPKATEKLALALVVMALVLLVVPSKYIFLLFFLDTFTRKSPPRKASTEKWNRRLREWWFSIPAAPVLLERPLELKKKK